MDIEKMTVRVQKSLNDAYSIAVKNHNQITILVNQSEIPLISTDIPFGFAKDGEQIFTENFTYQMNKALKLIEEGLQL